MKKPFIAALCFLMLLTAHAQIKLPDKKDQEAFKQLANQTVTHIERSIQKIPQLAKQGDKLQSIQQIELPARELQKDWKTGRYADAVMFSYSWCPNALGDLMDYAGEAFKPPRYEQSGSAQQKLKDMRENLDECKRLKAQVPIFTFSH